MMEVRFSGVPVAASWPRGLAHPLWFLGPVPASLRGLQALLPKDGHCLSQCSREPGEEEHLAAAMAPVT